jgi:hypothetical protein
MDTTAVPQSVAAADSFVDPRKWRHRKASADRIAGAKKSSEIGAV